MNAASAVFLSLSLILSILLGSQTRSWSWGPSLLLLAVSGIFALPSFWKTSLLKENKTVLSLGLLIAAWISWRAAMSPVREFAVADLMLLASAVGAFVATHALARHKSADTIFLWGLCLLSVANLLVLGRQLSDPAFSAIFYERPATYPSGLFSHYNDGANFLIGSSLLLLGVSAFSHRPPWSRILIGLIAIAGLIAVFFTRSRGGILAVAIALGVFGIFALIQGKRQKAKCFAPLAILFPILTIVGIGILLKSWAVTQEFRFSEENANAVSVLDNSSRLSMLGLAFSSIGLHPFEGGGSRSFSWECFKFWTFQDHGSSGATRPEFVHNELLQAATDYGIISAVLILGLLFTVFILGLLRTTFAEKSEAFQDFDAWRIGGAAGLAGMLCQSSFSFVFHLLPGAMLLGICLARALAGAGRKPTDKPPLISAFLLTLAGVASTAFLALTGWTATRLGKELFPIYLKTTAQLADLERIDRLTAAISISPQAAFYRDRGFIYQKRSLSENPQIRPDEARDSAISDYQKAIHLNPYDAIYSVNLANLLSSAGRNAEAEAAYQKTLHLQGGMEAGFLGHFSYAEHLLKKGTQLLNAHEDEKALEAFIIAGERLDDIAEQRPWILRHAEGIQLKTGIYEGLGLAREAVGDFKEALASYAQMAEIPEGTAGRYRAAALYSKLAAEKWNRRQPAQALALFLKAQEQIQQANQLPSGIPESQKLELAQYIEQSIHFLQKARVTPADPGF